MTHPIVSLSRTLLLSSKRSSRETLLNEFDSDDETRCDWRHYISRGTWLGFGRVLDACNKGRVSILFLLIYMVSET